MLPPTADRRGGSAALVVGGAACSATCRPPSPQRTWGVLNFSLFVSTPLVILVEIGLLLVAAGAGRGGHQRPARPAASLRISASACSIRPTTRRRSCASTALFWRSPGSFSACWSDRAGSSRWLKSCSSRWRCGRWPAPPHPRRGLIAGALAGSRFCPAGDPVLPGSTHADGNWLALTVGRAGTGLLHITTAALMGIAPGGSLADPSITCASALTLLCWSHLARPVERLQRVERLSATDLRPGSRAGQPCITNSGSIAPYGLVILAIGFLACCWAANRSLRAAAGRQRRSRRGSSAADAQSLTQRKPA